MPTLRSPRYNISIEANSIAANGVYYRDLRAIPECAHQIPYNTILIRNFSTNRLRVKYGETIAMIGASEVYADDEAYGLSDITIENMTNAANDDLIFITISRGVSTNAALIAVATGKNLFEIANGDV